MQFATDVKLLILIAAANTAPLMAKFFLRNRFARPIDNGAAMSDGQPVFGHSKTIRGACSAIASTSVLAALLGFAIGIGFWIGVLAMTGDLCSSFIKRRLRLQPSSKATGLDQIPESLLPALFGWRMLSLSLGEALAVTAIFFVGEVVVSKFLFRLRLRDRPY